MLLSAVTISTRQVSLCNRGMRQIIVEDEIIHPLIGRPILDEMGFVASQHLDFVRDKFHLDDFSHIGDAREAFGPPFKASTQARGHSRVY
jgi:hypothetical protein